MKTLKQTLKENGFNETLHPERNELIIKSVREWLTLKRQELEEIRLVKTAVFTLENPIIHHQCEIIDELLEEIKE